VSRPSGFERRDDAIWDWFRTHLPDDDARTADGKTEERAPYRGLAAFTTEDASLFVGRVREIEFLVNRLLHETLIAVVGPSGAGKSSFVHAGVIPALPEGWRVISSRPGNAPLAALTARLARDGLSMEATGAGVLVIVIDQFEEVFTLCSDEDERRAFFAALAQLTRSTEASVRVIITLRDDFLMRAEREPSLRERLARGLQLVGTPGRAELERILIEPARRAGYELEDRRLAEEMVDAVLDRPGALALLSFTAAQMWTLRDRHFKQLTRKVYEAIGGVVGALAQHAENTMATLGIEEQRHVRDAFRHLVTADGKRAVLSRGELLEVMGASANAALVAEKLIQARLLSVSEAENGADRIEVTHEALLIAWPRLVGWRQEDAEGARLRDQLRVAARQWDERGHPDGLLWRDDALTELQLWIGRHGAAMPSLDRAFAEASTAIARRARARRRALQIAAFSILSLLSAGLFQLSQRARARRRRSRRALRRPRSTSAARRGSIPCAHLPFAGDARRSRRGIAALPRRARARAARLARAKHHCAQRLRERCELRHRRQAHPVELEERHGRNRRRRLGTEPRRVRSPGAGVERSLRRQGAQRRDGRVRRQAALVRCHERRVQATVDVPGTGETLKPLGAIDPEATRIFVARGASLSIWDARTRTVQRTFDAGGSISDRGAVATPDGATIVVLRSDGGLRVLDVASGRTRAELALGFVARRLALAPDGAHAAVGGATGELAIVDLATKRVARLQGHLGAVASVHYASDGATILSSAEDGVLRLWTVADGRLRQSLTSRRDRRRAARARWLERVRDPRRWHSVFVGLCNRRPARDLRWPRRYRVREPLRRCACDDLRCRRDAAHLARRAHAAAPRVAPFEQDAVGGRDARRRSHLRDAPRHRRRLVTRHALDPLRG